MELETPRQEIRRMGWILGHLKKMGVAGQEFIAAWLLNTTQDELRLRGFFVRAYSRES